MIEQKTMPTGDKTIQKFISICLIPILYSTIVISATIYIDPTNNSSNQNGSISNPFNSWSKVSFVSGNTYLQKSGTTTNNRITFNGKNNITIGAYGSGSKPIIKTSGTGLHIIYIANSYNITVKDVELTTTGTWSSAITIQGLNAANNIIRNCYLHNVEWGIRILTPAGGTKILNSTIRNIRDDGIFAQDVSSIEIGYCYIADVNRKYQVNTSESYAAGDGIQIGSTNNLSFNIHNNTIDHSSMGNKACIIVWGNNFSGVIEKNIIIGNIPKNASGIYLHQTSKTVVIRYNVIKNSAVGITTNASMIDAYYNTILGNKVGVMVNPGYKANVRNNVIYNNTKYGIQTSYSTTLTLRNNIFNTNSSAAKALYYQGAVSSNYNVFGQQYSGFINGYPTLSIWRSNTGNDQNSMVGNPNFTNPSNGDFHVHSNSIVINKGMNVGLTRDQFGGSVPQAGIVDIGIHEYSSTKSGEEITVLDSISGEEWNNDIMTIDGDTTSTITPAFKVYPNPSSDGRFYLSFFEQPESGMIEIYDLSGNLVHKEVFNGNHEQTIDLTLLPSSTYLLRTIVENQTLTVKIVKAK